MASAKAPKFEASFTGLDLSEFASNNAPIQSASSTLLKVKQKEVLKKQMDAEEEAHMQQKAAEKARSQLKKLEEQKEKNEQPQGFYGALVSMHGTDFSGGKKEKSSAKTKAQKRTVNSKFKTVGIKKSKVVKQMKKGLGKRR